MVSYLGDLEGGRPKRRLELPGDSRAKLGHVGNLHAQRGDTTVTGLSDKGGHGTFVLKDGKGHTYNSGMIALIGGF